MKTLLAICLFASIGLSQTALISDTDMDPCGEELLYRILSVEHTASGTIEITQRRECRLNFIWAIPNAPTISTRVWKDVYGVKNGRIVLLKTVEGKIIPERRIEEQIEWPRRISEQVELLNK